MEFGASDWQFNISRQIGQMFGLPSDLLESPNSSTMQALEDTRRNFHRKVIIPKTQTAYWAMKIALYLAWYLERLEWDARHYAPDTDMPWCNYPYEPMKPLGIIKFAF